MSEALNDLADELEREWYSAPRLKDWKNKDHDEKKRGIGWQLADG